MKKNLFMPAVALLLLSGCNYNEENFKGLEEMTQPENVINIDYTLTAEDYTTFEKGSNPQKYGYFATIEEADELFPAWLAEKYYTASPTSVVRVTFESPMATSDVLKPYTNIKYVDLGNTNADYKIFYGDGYFAPYLTPATEQDIISKILNVKYADPKKGDIMMVSYRYNEKQLPQAAEELSFLYDFEADKTVDPLERLKNWFIKTTGDNQWKITEYGGSKYVQYTAYKAEGKCEAWLVTPDVKIESADKNFAFDVAVGNWNADCLSVLVSTDFDGENVDKANWKNITSNFTFPKQEKGYSKMATAGKASLSEYAGQTIRIAFKYEGDGVNNKTTTYQIDNIIVGKEIPKIVATTPAFKLFECKKDGVWSDWKNEATNVAFCPEVEDYTEMGKPATDMCFSITVKPKDYFPAYLSSVVPYPLDETAKVIIYRYLNPDKTFSAQAKEYIYSSELAQWVQKDQITRQYAFDGSKWMFDPSTTVTLKAKGDQPTSDFYQIITNWVKDNKGAEYVTSFGNNDYYYGGSAYNNNFDFRPSAWRAQNVTAYGEKSDDDLKKLMQERLPEAFVPGLEAKYPNAEPAEGVNVIYTVNFFIYDGSATTSWTIKYEVKEKGKFTYVENSLAEVK